MKKLLLFATLFLAIALKAQTTNDEVLKLSELVKIGGNSTSQATQDSVIVEMQKLVDNSSSATIKTYGKQAITSMTELKNISKDVVFSKPLSDLSKEDLKNFRWKEDKFKGITFIHHKKETGRFLPYLSIKSGVLNMRIQTYYSGKDWIFYKEVILLNNGEKYTFNVPDADHNVHSGYVSETSDDKAPTELIDFLRKAVNSNADIDVRYQGKYSDDRKLKKNEVELLKETIELYDKLKK